MLTLLPPKPTDLSFPDKYANWRPGQAESIERILFSGKRVNANCAPTGFGKSQCYMTEAVIDHGRVEIVTQTNGLLDQLKDDYAGMGIAFIKGKDNYQCSYKPGTSCKDGFASGCPVKGDVKCPYTKAYNTARASKIVATNFKFHIAVHKYGTGLGQFNKIIFDEADTCPDELADSMQVCLSYREIEELLELSFPVPNSDGPAWKLWAGEARMRAKAKFEQKQAQIIGSRDPRPSWVRDFHHLKNMVQKLATVALMNTKEWVWEEFDWGWQFDPIKFHRYTESRLFLNIPNVSLYSATIRPKTLGMLGIGKDDSEFIEHPSVFDPARSPVYYVPTMRLNRTVTDLTYLILRIDQIAGPRLKMGRNGIIPVTSFDYRDKICRQTQYRTQSITHWDKSPAVEAVKRFREQGGLLVSPSIWSGYNFVDDECRFTIMPKVPFRPRTKVVKAREEIDPYYGPYNVARLITQGVGRATRSEKDWSESFLLDDNFVNMLNRYQYFFPRSFIERFKAVNAAPRPLEMR